MTGFCLNSPFGADFVSRKLKLLEVDVCWFEAFVCRNCSGILGVNVCCKTSRGLAVNARGLPPGANGPIGGGGGLVVASF